MQSSNHQSTHDVCQALADNWADLLTSHNCTMLLHSKLQCYTLLLAKQLVTAMSTEPIDRSTIQAVGAAVARLCNGKEEVLGRTQELIVHHLLKLPSTADVTFQPHILLLVGELATGFVRQIRVEQMLPDDALRAEPTPAEVVQVSDKVHLNALLANLPVVLFTTDLHGIITFSGGQGLQRLGIPSERLVGHAVPQICYSYFPHDAENILHHFYRALEGESLHEVGSANHIVFDIQYDPLRDDHGAFIGVIGVALDVTEKERVKLELTEAHCHLTETQILHELHLVIKRLIQDSPASPSIVSLSEQDITFMRLLMAGKTNLAISQELRISQRTVTNRLQSIIGKLGVNSRAEAIRSIVELGLIKP